MRSVLLALSVVTAVAAQQTAWGQCGGINWSGPTTCVSGYTCTFNGDYYSQCIPGQAPAPTTKSTSTRLSTTSAAPTTTPTGIVTITSSKSPSTTPTTTSPSVPAGTGPGTVLQSGYYWIRAVEAPNFHKYLQTSPTYSTGTAILDSYTTAGQFQVVSGQLVELITPTTFLYANVIPASTAGANKLAVVFSATKNTYGTFAWSGDALQWSVAGLSRPNLSAWLVCGQQSLWINLGSYSYMTPAGCADETIHFYNDKTANS